MNESCLVDECDRPIYRQSLCRRHHYRLSVHGSPTAGGPLRCTKHTVHCTVDGCGNRYLAKGLCAMHYMRRRMHGDPHYQEHFSKDDLCTIRGCGDLQTALGYCG